MSAAPRRGAFSLRGDLKPTAVGTSDGGYIRKRDRVAIAPHTDAWMRGDRYGVVETLGPRWVGVRTDSGRLRKFAVTVIDDHYKTADVMVAS
jgi:hypothetical protein